MNFYKKEDYLVHYGVKGMKWKNHRKKKTIEFNNKTDAYRYDTNNNWFKKVVAETKIPGRSGTHMLSTYANTLNPNKKETTVVQKRETIIDQGKRIIDDILENIGGLFANIFKKK